MLGEYVICKNCKKPFRIERTMYIGNAPIPKPPLDDNGKAIDDEILIETHVTLFIDERRELKVPTFTTTFTIDRKCPNCGHPGHYTHKDLVREKELDETKIKLLKVINKELKAALEKAKDRKKREKPPYVA